ncbi:MAG: glycosyl transferase family 2 [Thermomicrobiales bacterium]|jgi:hypothetical protein|nr:glycosyl transferase family 2 [Thermomicrobiales bacterium]MDF3014811.1 glycosyl transferase family 2 [Thermomicrobiales bacterium]
MRIHALATTPQYRRHVEAVWKHLDPSLKGDLLVGRTASTKRYPTQDVVMVGGYYDVANAPHQRIIYVEHGAGQAYGGDETSRGHLCYHGSNHPKRVVGYISPSEQVARLWNRPAFAAGVPALDDIPRRPIRFARHKVAAITFHFDARGAFVAPEARSAREHYIEMLHSMVGALRADGWEVIGTWHPKDPVGHKIWRNLQIESTADPAEILSRAHLVIADNTSLLYEAAYLGIPSIVLNAPWYRKDVEHGLRFWDHVPGHQVDSPEEFIAFDFTYWLNGMKSNILASSAALYAYGPDRHGHAGAQAARWVEKFVMGEV